MTDHPCLSIEEKLARLKAELTQLYSGQTSQAISPRSEPQEQVSGSMPFDEFCLGRVRTKEPDKSKESEQGFLVEFDLENQ